MVKLVKKSLLLALLAVGLGQPCAEAKKKQRVIGQGAHYEILMKTSEGKIKLRLYNDTPVHRDNFAKLAREGFYNNLIFHRVIRDFMIQTGDPDSKEAMHTRLYGVNDAGYKLDAEINPRYYHRRGALAAARQGDASNPERKSSGSQFYIVTGREQNDSTLRVARERIESYGNPGHEITPERERVYRKDGGSPHLDGGYTIFGEVISGMGTVQKISKSKTGSDDRPRENIYIKSVTVKEVADKGKYKEKNKNKTK